MQSIQCRKNYESKKAEEAERKRQDIQNEINKLESTNNELMQKNEKLYNSRYEQFKKYKQGMELKKRMETEIEELSKQENNLKEYLIRNAEIIRNWKNEVESKINGEQISVEYLPSYPVHRSAGSRGNHLGTSLSPDPSSFGLLQ